MLGPSGLVLLSPLVAGLGVGKDTSGPSLNVVMKLSAIISLVFGIAIKHYSNDDGASLWLQ